MFAKKICAPLELGTQLVLVRQFTLGLVPWALKSKKQTIRIGRSCIKATKHNTHHNHEGQVQSNHLYPYLFQFIGVISSDLSNNMDRIRTFWLIGITICQGSRLIFHHDLHVPISMTI